MAEAVERPDPISKGKTQTGIRLMRAGGSTCPHDKSEQLSVTFDVWCDPMTTGEPGSIISLSKGPLDDDDADPCNVYISMEHANGCVLFDLKPFLIALGTLMIFLGVLL